MPVWFDEDAIKQHLCDNGVEYLTEVALEVAETAKDINPERSGYHSEHIGVFGHEERDGLPVVFVGSSAPTWHLLEYGSAHNPPFRALTQAAEQHPLVTYTPEPK